LPCFGFHPIKRIFIRQDSIANLNDSGSSLKIYNLLFHSFFKVTTSNGPCVFPFKYKNVMHHQCTYEIHPSFNNKTWCCLNSDCDANFSWGNCPGKSFA
jgi:hypothetical protein